MKPIQVDVLSAAEAKATRDKVHALRSLWFRKGGVAEFYTLGASAYLDAQYGGGLAYQMLAKKLNPVLEAQFGDVHQRVLDKLIEVMGEPVQYYPRLARPGFHIFLADAVFENPICKIHVDMPYSHILWQPWEQVDITRGLSFTLSLALPAGGGGLNLWPQIPPEDALAQGADPDLQTKGLEPLLFRYSVGSMVIHHGHTIHQIAPFRGMQAGDERITLQGHAIHSSQGWLAYF